MILSVGFAIIFCITLLFVMLLLTYMVVDRFIAIVQMFVPNFMARRDPYNDHVSTKAARAQVRRVALDFMMAHRRESQRPAPQRYASPSLMMAETMAPIRMHAPVAKPVQNALFALCRFVDGDLRRPQYLCRKQSTRGGLRTAWANLPQERLLMPREVCERWVGSILPAAVIVPIGRTARQECAADLEILRSYEEEEIQRSAYYVRA